MTDTNTLRVETRALVAYGVERYEDSVVYGAVRRFLADIGSIPAGAWGTLPISDQLRRDWASALDNRLVEANTARDEMQRICDVLLQVATDYEGTDLQIATTFDLANRDLAPYLPVIDGYTTQVRVSRGGAGVLPEPVDPLARFDPPMVVIPPDNDRLLATRHEILPSTREVEEPIVLGSSDGNDLTISGGRTTYYDNGDNDRLNDFVQQYRDILLQLEALLTDLGTGHRLPLSDLIVHAWRSSPSIIRNRADLLHSAANTYHELRTTMDAETGRLALYWEGTAAAAFGQYAELATTYLGKLEEQARWLAEEGKKAASLLEGLRNAYAATGFERIGALINAMTEYRHKVSGLFSSCSNPEQALIAAVNMFVDFLSDSEARHVKALADLIRIDEQERHERPDIGSRGHDVTPFPRPEVGTTVWTDPNGWRPDPNRPAT